MRKASVISVIVAGVIMIAGIIVCAFGGAYAKKDNFMLFPASENGESVYKYDFTGQEIARISITTEDADVYFKRGGESSYIEIYNFNANYYKLSSENNLITFTQVSDVASMFKFWEGGFSFKGMRYIFRFDADKDENRRVVVNLAEGTQIPAISVASETGKTVISSMSLTSDVTLNLAGASAVLDKVTLDGTLAVSSNAGSLAVKDSSFSSFFITGASAEASVSGVQADLCRWEMKSGKVSAENVTAAEFAISTNDAQVSAKNLLSDKISAISVSGQLVFTLADSLDSHSGELTSKSGAIFADGVHYTSSFTLPGDDGERTLNVTSDSGSVSVEGTE